MSADLSEADVAVATADGSCDAALIHPAQGDRYPGVLLYTDAFGLRPAMRDIGRRLAREGYVVLIPNPYYRSAKAPGVFQGINLSNPADRRKIMELRALLTADAVASDAGAYIEFLDSHRSVEKNAKMGAVGYCMGGAMTMRAAAHSPDRMGAGVSLHGGGLVTDKPDSPHLLVQKLQARYYFGVAADDVAKDPRAKLELSRAFEDSGKLATIEVYEGCMHGWCVKDMPASADGRAIYNEAQAERAWRQLVNLFKQSLV